VRLLDTGTGQGWPGLYLAASTGCDVVLSDLPVDGLRTALDRATAEGLAARVHAVASSAAQLPLRPGSVDAVVSSDVLC
jgi:cyclopropane fatty-acyl-phospholipid synthase-like methyltransferase